MAENVNFSTQENDECLPKCCHFWRKRISRDKRQPTRR